MRRAVLRKLRLASEWKEGCSWVAGWFESIKEQSERCKGKETSQRSGRWE